MRKILFIFCSLFAVILCACILDYDTSESKSSDVSDAFSEASYSFTENTSKDDIQIDINSLPNGTSLPEYDYTISYYPSYLPRSFERLTDMKDYCDENGIPYAVCIIKVKSLEKGLNLTFGVDKTTPMNVEIVDVLFSSRSFSLKKGDLVYGFDRTGWENNDKLTRVVYSHIYIPITETEENAYYIAEIIKKEDYGSIVENCEYEIQALTLPLNKNTVSDKDYRNKLALEMELTPDTAKLSEELLIKYGITE